jgi:hypothetical protein
MQAIVYTETDRCARGHVFASFAPLLLGVVPLGDFADQLVALRLVVQEVSARNPVSARSYPLREHDLASLRSAGRQRRNWRFSGCDRSHLRGYTQSAGLQIGHATGVKAIQHLIDIIICRDLEKAKCIGGARRAGGTRRTTTTWLRRGARGWGTACAVARRWAIGLTHPS